MYQYLQKIKACLSIVKNSTLLIQIDNVTAVIVFIFKLLVFNRSRQQLVVTTAQSSEGSLAVSYSSTTSATTQMSHPSS